MKKSVVFVSSPWSWLLIKISGNIWLVVVNIILCCNNGVNPPSVLCLLFILLFVTKVAKMAFRVIKQRREARRNAKLEEIFLVSNLWPQRIYEFNVTILGKRQASEWDNFSWWYEGCLQDLWGIENKLNVKVLTIYWLLPSLSWPNNRWRNWQMKMDISRRQTSLNVVK